MQKQVAENCEWGRDMDMGKLVGGWVGAWCRWVCGGGEYSTAGGGGGGGKGGGWRGPEGELRHN